MQEITFKNANEKSITLKDTFPYLLQNLEGLGSPEISVLTQKGFQQNGTSYFGNLLNPRLISFRIVISADERSELIAMREKVFQVFNPGIGKGELIYINGEGRYQINCSVYVGPKEIISPGLRNASMQSFEIALFCPRPAWEIEKDSVEMVGFSGGVEFLAPEVSLEGRNPFAFGYENSLMLGTQSDYVLIDYKGTLAAPLLIVFEGPANLPKITKINTGEYVKVNLELFEGDKLYINTQPDAIDVYKEDSEGTKTPAFNYIDTDSSYFLLTPGENEISFSAGSGEPTVHIKYFEQYVGV